MWLCSLVQLLPPLIDDVLHQSISTLGHIGLPPPPPARLPPLLCRIGLGRTRLPLLRHVGLGHACLPPLHCIGLGHIHPPPPPRHVGLGRTSSSSSLLVMALCFIIGPYASLDPTCRH